MGLITKEVEILLYGSNISYYENLGYKIPREKNSKGVLVVKRGTKIKVRVEDLPKYSSAKIHMECDLCNRIKYTEYSNYTFAVHENGETYCQECAIKLFCSGENNYSWNHTLTEQDRIDRENRSRRSSKYINFIKTVMKRDNYTCQCCMKKKDDINVHHLDGYNWCIEKRTDPQNGITLCETCHSNFHSIYPQL